MRIYTLKESLLKDMPCHRYLDDEIKSAIWDYVVGYTTSVNNELRKGRVRIASVVTNTLDLAFTDKMPNLDVYRTVDWDFMKNIFGITPDNIDDYIGDIIVDKGYMSTASVMKSPWGSHWMDGELILHIVSNKPVGVIDVNKRLPPEDIDCEDQSEIILPRSTRLKILSYRLLKGRKYANGGTYLIETEFVGIYK